MEERGTISIMGCGWLGLPLAERLEQLGYTIKGSTTSEKKLVLLAQKNILPYLLNLADEQLDEELLQDFLNADILVLNIPPHLRSDGGEGYLKQMHLLLKALLRSSVKRILFVSSTSVYQDLNRVVTEEDIIYTEQENPNHMLLQAERLFQDREDWLTTVVRFGGLVGGDRQPVRFLAGKKNVPNGDAPVNLIHLDDCVAILQRIVEQNKWGRTYHASADGHPLRKEFYTAAAHHLRLTPPEFNEMEKTHFKLINSQKIKDDLAYVFLHPEPMAFFS